MKNPEEPGFYIEGVQAGNRRILSRTITLIESSLPRHQALARQILEGLLPASGKAVGRPLKIEHPISKGSETILLVDDEAVILKVSRGMLEKLGYRVTAVDCGESAVEYLVNHTVDLIVLDMIMDPGIDGLETYQKILQIRPGQRTIIASGYSESDRVKEAQRIGAGTYIKKPYLIEKFGRAVRTELKRLPAPL